MYSTTARVVAAASPGHSPALTSRYAPFSDTPGAAVFRARRPMTAVVSKARSREPLVFLGLSVLELGPMYATDVRQHASALSGRRHNK